MRAAATQVLGQRTLPKPRDLEIALGFLSDAVRGLLVEPLLSRTHRAPLEGLELRGRRLVVTNVEALLGSPIARGLKMLLHGQCFIDSRGARLVGLPS
jgi:hypothetical protein